MATDMHSSRRRGGRHRKPSARKPYSWLGPAAFTVGIGAALVGGSAGIAHADDSAADGAPSAGSTKTTRAGSSVGDSPTTSGRATASRASRQLDSGVRQAVPPLGSVGKSHAASPAASSPPAASASPTEVNISTTAGRSGGLDTGQAGGVLSLQQIAPSATATVPAVNAVTPTASATLATDTSVVSPAAVTESVVPVAPQAVAAPAGAVANAASGLLATIRSVASLFSGGSPVAPVGGPVVWALAAVARQEIGAPAAATAAPAAAVSSGAPPTPAPAAAVPQPAASGPAKGTATVIQLVNVRPSPIASGRPLAQYTPGMTFNYDSYTDANGYRWLSYVSYSGARRYVAQQTLDGKTVYVKGGVPLASPAPTPTPTPTPTPPPASKADAAVAKAMSRVNTNDFGPQGCGKFVAYAYSVSGIGYNTALQFRNALASKGQIHMDYNIPKGALVFSQSKYDGGAGHVDIARGNGQYISGGVSNSYGTGYNVQLLNSWNPSPGAQYLGWAYAPW